MDSSLLGNDQRASDCNHLLHKVDELTIAFHKMRHGFTESYEFMSQHFKACSKLIDEIRVWPPSANVLVAELALVCNCLLVEMAQKIHLRSRSAPVCLQLDCLVCHTVMRVLQFALRMPVVPDSTQEKDTDIEMAMKKMVTVVKDPVSRFRLLDILGRLVLLCSLCCIYTRQKTGLVKTKSLLAVQDQLLKAVGKSVLEEEVPYRQGLILCEHDSKVADVVSICVGDVARLVTLSSQLTVEDGSVKHKEWQWLDTFLQCKKLITTEQYILAMKKLEIELSQPLDPEVKAILLCQFAKCYQKQGCPQLAIQTYKDALHIYKEHHSVLLHLANIYDIVGQQELQLEILNLLVKVLSAKSARNERPVFATDFETIVISVFQIMPKVSFLSAVYHLAKCCTQLHRYKEAADHYLKLLDLLKNIENFTLESTSDEPLLNTDVKELVVETTETLALAQRNNECLLLCDEFYPILSTDGTLPLLSQHMELHTHKEDSAHSLHSLFSLSQHSESPDEIINCSLEHPASSSSFPLSTKDKSNDSVCLTSGILGNLSSLSRKRNRSTSFDKDADSHKNIDEDIWSSRCLPVRLLLSKADALVATQGYTDEIVVCLKMASNLMMTSDTSIFVQDKDSFHSTSQPPLKKSKFSHSDNQTSEATNITTKLNPSEQIESYSEFKVSKTWANCMIKVALRMAKACLERHQVSSVLNSCHLVLQLDPRNISAHYLKTVALQKLSHQKYKASKQWLQERGIDSNSETALPLIVDEKQKKIREKQEELNTPSGPWWEISELCLLNLDVVSLNNITEHIQNQLKAS